MSPATVEAANGRRRGGGGGGAERKELMTPATAAKKVVFSGKCIPPTGLWHLPCLYSRISLADTARGNFVSHCCEVCPLKTSFIFHYFGAHLALHVASLMAYPQESRLLVVLCVLYGQQSNSYHRLLAQTRASVIRPDTWHTHTHTPRDRDTAAKSTD